METNCRGPPVSQRRAELRHWNEHLTEGNTSRRDILTAGAWSVPVIAFAAAAPSASASACPTLTSEGDWTAIVTSGSFGLPATGAAGWIPNPPRFAVVRDNASTTGPAILTLTANINVVAGRTYAFSFAVRGNLGNSAQGGGSSRQTLDVQAGTSVVYRGTTKNPDVNYSQLPTTGNAEVPSEWGVVARSFVAATTGSIPFRYTFTVGARPNAVGSVSDDIRITVPTFTSC